MNINELDKRIEELKNHIFILSMKDRWNSGDYQWNSELHNELRKLEAERAAL